MTENEIGTIVVDAKTQRKKILRASASLRELL